MTALQREDLWSLEEYAERRPQFRAEVIAHKKNRQVAIGDHLTLYFEDAKTIRYQIQEMLRIEKVFERAGIEDELSAYNPLIPDGSNWKATCMIEYADPQERRLRLSQLGGIEDLIWVQVDGHDKVYAIADEDLDRTEEGKTSAVHFMRFELSAEMVTAVKGRAPVSMGCDHQNYHQQVPVAQSVLESLRQDLA